MQTNEGLQDVAPSPTIGRADDGRSRSDRWRLRFDPRKVEVFHLFVDGVPKG